MAQQRLKLTRQQLSRFLDDHDSIKQFEKLFEIVDEVDQSVIGDPFGSIGESVTSDQIARAIAEALSAYEIDRVPPPITLSESELWEPTPPEARVIHDHSLEGLGTYASPLVVPPYLYFGCITRPSYADNGNGTVTIGSDGVYSLSDVASGDVIPFQFTIAGGIFTPVDGSLSYLVADYNAGTPILYITSTVTIINETTIIPVRTFFRTGNEIHQVDWDTLGVALPNKIHQSIVKTERFRRQDGLALGEIATRRISLTSGTVWIGATSILNAAFDQTTDLCDLYYHVAGVWNKVSITQYNNTQYDDGTSLVALTGSSKYAVNFIYRLVNSTDKHCLVVLGQDNYLLPEAQQSQPPPNLPPEITSMCVLVGRIIVANGAAIATQIDSAFVSTFTPSATTNHNDLALLQGGTTGEYYHLTSAQHAIATQAATAALSGYVTAGSQSFLGAKTFTRSDATNTAVTVSQTSSTQAAGLYIQAGNGTTSARYSFIEYRSLETTPAIWITGMYALKNYQIRDAATGDSPLDIVGASAGLITLGGSTNRPITFTAGTFTSPGLVRFTNATASTSSATGALVVTGGVGVGGTFWLGGVASFLSEIVLPKTSGMGIKVDTASPTFPFVDFLGNMIPDPGGANSPVLTAISGGNCRCWAYTTSDRMDVHVHLPHDYVPGSDLYVHAHWLHNGTGISGNWTATINHQYGKGHAQGVLTAQKTVTLTYATVNIATTPQYQHRIEEVQLSTPGGSATLLDSSVLEPDGIIFLHFTLTSLPTITGGATTRVFVPYIDIHAQSTGIGTKQKAPNFYV